VRAARYASKKYQLAGETVRVTALCDCVQVGCEGIACAPGCAVLPQAVGMEVQPRIVRAESHLELGVHNGRRNVPGLKVHVGACSIEIVEASPD
jgi:hypothetical protein